MSVLYSSDITGHYNHISDKDGLKTVKKEPVPEWWEGCMHPHNPRFSGKTGKDHRGNTYNASLQCKFKDFIMWYKCKERVECIRGTCGGTVHLSSSLRICIWSSSIITPSVLKHHVSDSLFPCWSRQWWMEIVMCVSLWTSGWVHTFASSICTTWWVCVLSLPKGYAAWCLGGANSQLISPKVKKTKEEVQERELDKVWRRVSTSLYCAIKKFELVYTHIFQQPH